jgi:hypothetical protein
MAKEQLTDAEKQVFLDATNRRKAAGIRLKRISIMASTDQVEAFNELWSSWVERWGKNTAVDHLIRMMAHIEAKVRNG